MKTDGVEDFSGEDGEGHFSAGAVETTRTERGEGGCGKERRARRVL
jgi:hypothetical protein